MSEPLDVRSMLAAADRAASAGDLVSAEELLKNAAHLQEKELGPSHPELANTLNNLAIVAETGGRLDDAETLYRRAVAITSTSLPPGDPMVAASRRNLEDFCRAHGRTIPQPAATAPVSATPTPAPAVAPVSTPATAPRPALKPAAPVSGSKAASTPRPPDSKPPSTVSRPSSRAPAAIAIGVLALVILTFLVARPWSERRAPATAPAAEAPREQAPPAEPARPAPDAVSPGDRSPAPVVDKAPGTVALVTVQLCRTFSTSDFRCGTAGDSIAPGPIVLYTRVRSPRDSVIVHRWFRGDTLVKSAQLRIGANAAEGYRTYSRETVDGGDWRVEVRTAQGELLHEQRLAVR